MAWATCTSLGATVGIIGGTAGSTLVGVNSAQFSTNDAGTFETRTDSGSGLDYVGFLQEGFYYIVCWSRSAADAAALTVAQQTTLRNTCLQAAPSEVFDGGSFSLRSRIADGFYAAWGSGAVARSTVAPLTFEYHSMGAMLLDLPTGGDNLTGYGILSTVQAQTDLVTGAVWPSNITTSTTLQLYRLGDSVPVASLPWW